MKKDKFIWLTDTHLNNVSVFNKLRFFYHISREKPRGIFLTGDISNGLMTSYHLNMMATMIKCPIYFVLGNHDYYWSSFEDTHNKIKALCNKHDNLIWMTDRGVVPLNDKVVLIGTEGWYDASLGQPQLLKATLDWMMIKEFRSLPTMDDRIKLFKRKASESALFIESKIIEAFELGYKTIYLLTHFPPWKEATRDYGTFMEDFWLPYNVNNVLGKKIEELLLDKKKRSIKVLAGHIHEDCFIHVKNNISCKVNSAKYYGSLRNEETIFI